MCLVDRLRGLIFVSFAFLAWFARCRAGWGAAAHDLRGMIAVGGDKDGCLLLS